MQRALAELIAREVKDPRVGNVTITAVDLAPDLRRRGCTSCPSPRASGGGGARGSDARRRAFCAVSSVGALGLRHAPRLEFVFDDTVEKARAA